MAKLSKYNIYAVGYGIDPDTKQVVTGIKCSSWDECKKYVNGINGARFKGFLTDGEADEWLKRFNTTEEPKQETHYEESRPVKNSEDERFIAVCNKFGLSVYNTERFIKKMFCDTVKYLEENVSLNIEDLPFK